MIAASEDPPPQKPRNPRFQDSKISRFRVFGDCTGDHRGVYDCTIGGPPTPETQEPKISRVQDFKISRFRGVVLVIIGGV